MLGQPRNERTARFGHLGVDFRKSHVGCPDHGGRPVGAVERRAERSSRIGQRKDVRGVVAHHAVERDRKIAGRTAIDLYGDMFVANRGIVQIHTGPVKNVAPMGPWLNVMDPTFHLHLRADHIAEAWAVRKPTKDGHVTSVEAYDKNGEMIIQFFGKRKEGMDERADWREILGNLPRPDSAAA